MTIHLILGPMWAGKTSELLRRYKRYSVSGKKCLIIKHMADTRYTDNCNKLCTHDLHTIDAIGCQNLSDLKINMSDWNVLCIDEIQFYPDAIEFCEKLANSGIIIEASGLSSNYLREPFPTVATLIAKADSITFLTAICMKCKGDNAAFTKRISNETDELVVGGSDKYIAVCRGCYFL